MGRNAVTLVTRNASGIAYWDARWYDHDAGKRRSKTLGRCDKVSERQARKFVAQMEAEFGQDPRNRSPETVPTLKEWVELLTERKRAAGRKPKTVADYVTLLRLLIQHFGSEKRINEVSKFDLQQFRLRLSKHELHAALKPQNRRKANATSVTKYMRLVSAVFTAAFDDELIPRNPARKLGLEQSPASRWHKVTGEEFWKLYKVAPGSTKPLLALCRLAALRHSDATFLKWSNVRLDEGVLVFKPQKTERFNTADARVPISAELMTILLDLREKTKPGSEDTVVTGTALAGLRHAQLKTLCKRAGIAPWKKPLHTLRKSCIDDWTKIASPNVVMRWATHTSLSTTMKYYSQVSKGDEELGQQSLLPPPAAPPPPEGTPTSPTATPVATPQPGAGAAPTPTSTPTPETARPAAAA